MSDDKIIVIETFGDAPDMRPTYVRLEDYQKLEADNARLQAELDRLTKGERLPDGCYRPSKLEELTSDSEERDYWEEQAMEARADNARLRSDLESSLGSLTLLRQALATIEYALNHVECVDVEGPGFMLRPKAYEKSLALAREALAGRPEGEK